MTGLERTASMEARGRKPGGMRKLGPMMKLDNVIWLAGGLPHRSAFPMSEVRLEMAEGEDVVLDDMSVGMGSTAHNGNLYLAQQYLTTPRGYQPLVDWVEAHTKLLHGETPMHRTIIAGGNTAGTDMVCRILLHRDDSLVVCEQYSYPGFFKVAQNMGVPIVTAEMDADGMTPEALDAAIAAGLEAHPGRKKVMIYLGTCRRVRSMRGGPILSARDALTSSTHERAHVDQAPAGRTRRASTTRRRACRRCTRSRRSTTAPSSRTTRTCTSTARTASPRACTASRARTPARPTAAAS